MQRSAVHLIVALITFKTGVFVWRLNPLRFRPAEPSEPLRVTFTPTRLTASANVPFEHYLVTVENVSSKTIRGYSLRALTSNAAAACGPGSDRSPQ